MAETIKGINVVIGSDTTGLSKALADVNKKSRDIQSELRQVERLLKLDPKNTELLAQKQKLLSDAVANTREKLDRLRAAQQQVNEQFQRGEISEGQYRAFQREVVNAEQNLDKFEKQLRETGLTAEQVGQKLKDVGGKMTDMGKDLSMKVTAPVVAAGAASFKMAADLQDSLGATDQIFKSAADSVKKWADNLDEYYGIAEGDALEYANMMGSLLQNIGGLTQQEAAKQAQTLVQLAGDLTAMFGGTTEDAVRALTGALKGNTAMLDNYGIAANEAMIKTKAMEMGLVKEGEQLSLAAKQAATLALIMEQTGAAQGQAAREAEGASGSMRAFTTALKNLGTDIGETLLPVITPIIQKLSDIVKWFGELSPSAQKATIAIAGIAAAIGPSLVVFGQLAKAISSIIGLFGGGAAAGAAAGGAAAAGGGGLAAVFSAITGPVGIAIAAIAALAAAAFLIYKNWDGIKEFFTNLWNGITETLSAAWEGIKNSLSAIWEAIKNTAQTVWDSLVSVVMAIIGPFVNVVSGTFEGMKNGLATIWEGVKTYFSGVWTAIKNIFLGAILLILDLVTGNFTQLKADAEAIWNNLKDAFAQIWEGIKLVFSGALSAVSGAITGAWNAIKNTTTTIWNTTKRVLSDSWNSIKSAAANIWKAITDNISKALDWIKSLPSTMLQFGKDIIQGLIDGIKAMVDKLMDIARSIADRIRDTISDALDIGSPSRVMMELGVYTGEGFALGLKNTIDEVGRQAQALANAAIAQPAPQAIGTSNINYNSPLLTISGPVYVRNDQDIQLIARELFNLQQRAARARGLVT